MKKCVLFDFDGVLNDSVEVKTEAFLAVYREEASQEQLDKVKAYHLEHGGLSRKHKFKYFEEEVFGRSIEEDKIFKLMNEFEAEVMKGFAGDTLFLGAKLCLEEVRNIGLKIFIVSGAPEKEIRQILQRHDLCHFFSGVFDGEESKEFHIRNIMEQEDISSRECIFVGDSMTDYRASVLCNIDFYAVNANFSPQEKESSRFESLEKFRMNLNKLLDIE